MVIQKTQLNGTVSQTRWTSVGDTPAHACVDEGVDTNDGDTTYIFSILASAASIAKMTLATPAEIPVSNDNHSVVVTLKRLSGITGSPTVDISLIEGISTVRATMSEQLGSSFNSYANKTLNLTPAEAAAIVDFADLSIWVKYTTNPDTLWEVRCTAAEYWSPRPHYPEIMLASVA